MARGDYGLVGGNAQVWTGLPTAFDPNLSQTIAIALRKRVGSADVLSVAIEVGRSSAFVLQLGQATGAGRSGRALFATPTGTTTISVSWGAADGAYSPLVCRIAAGFLFILNSAQGLAFGAVQTDAGFTWSDWKIGTNLLGILPFNGDIAWAAHWDRALGNGETAALVNQFSHPLQIGGIKHYFPMMDSDPTEEYEWMTGTRSTTVNATTIPLVDSPYNPYLYPRHYPPQTPPIGELGAVIACPERDTYTAGLGRPSIVATRSVVES